MLKYSDNRTDPEVFTNEHSGYGIQWWVTQITDVNNRPTDIYYANGFGRQYIFVIPEYEAVIVSTADHNNISDDPGIGTVMRESLLLAFTGEEENVFPLTSDQNGSWFDPNMDGQGINIEILNDGNEFLGFWYTYEPNGGGQRWFVLSGSIENNMAEFTITSTNGGAFLNNTEPVRTEWGTGTFFVRDCSSAVMSFQSDSEAVSGDVELARLTTGPGGCIQSKQNKNLGPRLY